jgi:hypothetical protein
MDYSSLSITVHLASPPGAHPEFFLWGGGGADPEATNNLCDFKNYVVKIMLQVQHNTACNCIYIHASKTKCFMTQPQCLIVFFLI